jgi:glycosyltransferase involved in cell wall biosynthesis
VPRVSVVVPAYNAAATIEECVDSLLALHYPQESREVIVVDNGSTDRTRAVLDRYGTAISIVEMRRRGAAAARNAGIAHATGEIIAFTDADCIVDPDWLAELLVPLADVRIGIVGGLNLARPPANAIELYGERIHDHRRAIEELQPPYAITMNWASRRDVLDAVGTFDEGLLRGEDVDLAYRIFAAGYEIAFRPQAVIYHRNERTLAGLFREGWRHGFHAVPLLERYDELIRERARYAVPEAAERGVPARVFGIGRRCGRLSGELRTRRRRRSRSRG